MPTVEAILGNVTINRPPAAGGPAAWQSVVVPYVGEPAGQFERCATVAASGVTAGSVLEVRLADVLDEDENGPETLDVVALSAVPGADSFEVKLIFGALTSGPITLNWRAA